MPPPHPKRTQTLAKAGREAVTCIRSEGVGGGRRARHQTKLRGWGEADFQSRPPTLPPSMYPCTSFHAMVLNNELEEEIPKTRAPRGDICGQESSSMNE